MKLSKERILSGPVIIDFCDKPYQEIKLKVI